ncbi:MAG: hypothetical protein ACLFR7_06665 [Opitutales bacterium]
MNTPILSFLLLAGRGALVSPLRICAEPFLGEAGPENQVVAYWVWSAQQQQWSYRHPLLEGVVAQ